MVKDLDIYFCDLNKTAQKKVLEFLDIDSEEEGNFDVLPLATISIEKDE